MLIKRKREENIVGYKWKHITTYKDISGKSIQVREYTIWAHMNRRCNNPNADNYLHYGARGITVCDEWLSYDNFYEWAHANGYEDALTLDRIDVNGNYEPSNCRWADIATQNRNKRNSVKIGGKCAVDVAKEVGVSSTCIRDRLKSGYSSFEILNLPKDYYYKIGAEKRSKSRTKILIGGKSLMELSRISGISISTIRERYRAGARTLEELTRPVRGAK